MDHSRELYELMLLTYKSSLNHTKLAIKLQMENPSIIDSSCNCLNLSNIDGLIQKATNIEQKIAFLKANVEYLFNNKPTHSTTSSHSDSKTNFEPNTIIHQDITDKNNIKMEVSDKNDSEIVEVCKNEIIKEELYNKIKKETRDKILVLLNAEL